MAVLAGVFALVMILFAAAQYNDPDGPYWAAIYGIGAAWAGLAAFRPVLWRRGFVRGLFAVTALAALAGVAWYWPTGDGWWRVDVWWHQETVREGMGFMLVLAALAVAGLTARRRTRSAAAALVGLLMPTLAGAGEQQFGYVTALPEVHGEQVATVEGVDPATGRGLAKTVFEIATGDLRVRSHVARVSCTAEAPTTPYMVAVQYLPSPPETFAGATRYDRFAEVYVKDDDGRVRLYREVTGLDMRALTERFLPACPDV